MQPDIEARLKALEEKLDNIYVSAEKTRKYFLVTMWVTVILFVLPLVGLLFVVPKAMSSYLGSLGGMNAQDLQGL